MNSSVKKNIYYTYLFFDCFLLSSLWLLSYRIRFFSFFEVYKGVPDFYHCYKLLPFVWIAWGSSFFFSKNYREQLLNINHSYKFFLLCRLSFVGLLAFVTLSYFYEEYKYSRLTLLIFTAIQPFVLVVVHILLRRFLFLYLAKKSSSSKLIVGSGLNLIHFLKRIEKDSLINKSYRDFIILGSKEDQKICKQFIDRLHGRIHVFPEDWVDFLSKNNFEELVVALPFGHFQQIRSDISTIREQITSIRIIPDLMQYKNHGVHFVLNEDEDFSIIMHEIPLQDGGAFVKRLFDIVGGLLALLLFLPVMVIAVTAIFLSTGGPFLYTQRRMGLDGKVFKIYKFCTMKNDHGSSQPGWTVKDDKRRTFVGQFLRKYNIDELPQIFNVIKGDMSLVGPRPEQPYFVNIFRKEIPKYMLRHRMKSGITGWAQINGWRGDTSISKRIECDLYYIQNWSITFDIKIIFLTLFKSFSDPNAY